MQWRADEGEDVLPGAASASRSEVETLGWCQSEATSSKGWLRCRRNDDNALTLLLDMIFDSMSVDRDVCMQYMFCSLYNMSYCD